MPQKIDSLPKTSRGREKKYDFSKLYDGNSWMIVQGEDFDCEVPSIRQLIYREVNELGKSVKSSATEVNDKPALAFQVVDEPPRKRTPKSENGSKAKTETPAKS